MSYSGALPMGAIDIAIAAVPGAGPTLSVQVSDPSSSFLLTAPDGTLMDAGPVGGSITATVTVSDGGSAFPGSITAPVYPTQVELTFNDQ